MYTAPSPSSMQDTDLRPALYVLVLCMALIEFGQVWYFDASQHRLITERPFGGQYRALLSRSLDRCTCPRSCRRS